MRYTRNAALVWAWIRHISGFVSNKEIADASGLDYRMVRSQTRRMADDGILAVRGSYPQTYAIVSDTPATLVAMADEHSAGSG